METQTNRGLGTSSWEDMKRRKRSTEVFVKPYNPRPIKVTRWYETLEQCSEVEDERSVHYYTTPQWSGYTSHNGMYKSMYSPCEEDSSSSRTH